MWSLSTALLGERTTYPDARYEWAHCRDCGARVDWTAADCPSCGEAQRAVESDRDPDFAAAISVVLPGVGHLYVGDRKRGFLQLLATAFVLGLLVVVASERGAPFDPRAVVAEGPSLGSVGPWAFFGFQWLSSGLSAAHHARVRARETNYGLRPGVDAEACPDCDAANPESASYCRNCGLEFPESWSGPTETTYRFRTRDGVCFCEACNVQVSPSDRTCPVCDYELHVKEPISA